MDQNKEPVRMPEKRSVYSTAKGLQPKNTYGGMHGGASSPAIDSPPVRESKSPYGDWAVSPLIESINSMRKLKTSLDKLIHSPASPSSRNQYNQSLSFA